MRDSEYMSWVILSELHYRLRWIWEIQVVLKVRKKIAWKPRRSCGECSDADPIHRCHVHYPTNTTDEEDEGSMFGCFEWEKGTKDLVPASMTPSSPRFYLLMTYSYCILQRTQIDRNRLAMMMGRQLTKRIELTHVVTSFPRMTQSLLWTSERTTWKRRRPSIWRKDRNSSRCHICSYLLIFPQRPAFDNSVHPKIGSLLWDYVHAGSIAVLSVHLWDPMTIQEAVHPSKWPVRDLSSRSSNIVQALIRSRTPSQAELRIVIVKNCRVCWWRCDVHMTFTRPSWLGS